jgi:hypothetical protein
VQLRAGERPDRLERLVLVEAKRPIVGERVDEDAKVLEPIRMQPREKLRQVGLGAGGA